MSEKLTEQQAQAVNDRGGNLLVSAAAGSGKTKVLVDRLMSYLTDPSNPADIDNFLIITYTKAAAAELRGKIAAKLSERIAVNPENRHLQQQLQRLFLTKISTVHSFCADVLREFAYQLDISGDFRVADENECIELQERALDRVLNEAYENADTDEDFYTFINTQGFGRDDRQVPAIILKVYNSARCHLNPDKWLDQCVSACGDTTVTDALETAWGRFLADDLRSYLDLQIDALNRCICRARADDNMEKPIAVLCETVDQISALRNSRTWDQIRLNMDIDFGTLRFSSKCTDTVLVQQIKATRDACKKGIAKKLRAFSDDNIQVLSDTKSATAAIRGIVSLVKEYHKVYSSLKESRRILDFGDLEHRTLDLLLGKSRTCPTNIANEIGSRFREVMIDEYQDSNAVQDAIFTALTNAAKNCFMVGDVKQSIYQFRLADPGIFLEKYNSYAPAADAASGQGRKVLLSSNFRSASAVIQAVNDVFSVCMSPQVGGIVYSDEEILREGIPHASVDENEIELHGIEVSEDTYTEEANFVADRIKALLDGTHMIRDGEKLRPITAEDIVILLRSPGSVGGHYQFALEQRGIRCTTGAGADLLQTEEIETLISLLKIIVNPRQDIPLISVLSSRVFGFTANELAFIRSKNKQSAFYDSLVDDETDKTRAFLEVLQKLRHESQVSGISKLLRKIFAATYFDSIYAALDDGNTRVENLQNFSLIAAGYESSVSGSTAQFVDYLEILKERGLAANNEQNSSGSVTIMSIHKSKGLEFPVVFLSGLSRKFNREDLKEQVLCDKALGLGAVCIDAENRVRYPSLAKRAIAIKMTQESISEEMRVLYVAMTRARDRLIMTYALPKFSEKVEEMKARMQLCDPILITSDVSCPGEWVLFAALRMGWDIHVVQSVNSNAVAFESTEGSDDKIPSGILKRLQSSLLFNYQHILATTTPSKQTATQLKGRGKDVESAENAGNIINTRTWRKPAFIQSVMDGKAKGNVMHTVMQYIQYAQCNSLDGIHMEISRLVQNGHISEEQAKVIDPNKIQAFFATEIGRDLITQKEVIREFKFSVLVDAQTYYEDVVGEKMLLQGVVDCAIIEDDGITLIDFKTDRVTKNDIAIVADKYRSQLVAYANALSKIFQKPIKSAQLYFFETNSFIIII